jgi:cytoskeletal protein RodZ
MASEKDITLGEFLRQERERRGITIEQVASATKVGVRTLHSLEADHYAELPAKPFIRGFVTSYCRFIGLDPKETLARFDDFIVLKGTERPNREQGHSGYAFEKKDGEQQSRTILLIAMCSFVVLGGLAMLFLKPSLRHHRGSHIDRLRAVHQTGAPEAHPGPSAGPSSTAQAGPDTTKLAPVVGQSPAPVPAPSPTAVEVVAKPGVPGGNPADPLDSGLELKPDEIHHKVSLKVLADIWVRYRTDERPIRKFIIRKGKSLILRGKDRIYLQVSNPNSVTLSYNSRKFELISHVKDATVRQGTTTLFFPKDGADQIEKPFGEVGQLPKTEDPKTESSTTVQPPAAEVIHTE